VRGDDLQWHGAAGFRIAAFLHVRAGGNLVHHDVLTPDGVTFVQSARIRQMNFSRRQTIGFAGHLAVGPDGALYVCDMYRKTIEHPEYFAGRCEEKSTEL